MLSVQLCRMLLASVGTILGNENGIWEIMAAFYEMGWGMDFPYCVSSVWTAGVAWNSNISVS